MHVFPPARCKSSIEPCYDLAQVSRDCAFTLPSRCENARERKFPGVFLCVSAWRYSQPERLKRQYR